MDAGVVEASVSPSQRALADALKRMLSTTPLAKVTVSALACEAGVHRQTFYRYFHDVYDLAVWVFSAEIAQQVLSRAGHEEWADGFVDLLRYLRAHRQQTLSVLASVSHRRLERFLYVEFRQMMRAVADDVQGELVLTPADRDFVIDHYTVAVVGHLLHWLAGDMRVPPLVLASNIEFVMRDGVRASLERFAQRE